MRLSLIYVFQMEKIRGLDKDGPVANTDPNAIIIQRVWKKSNEKLFITTRGWDSNPRIVYIY